jgi:hypothetical protein
MLAAAPVILYLRLMRVGLLLSVAIVAAGLLLDGCAAKRESLNEPASTTQALASLSAPLDLQNFQIVDADGNRGVFLKLSRLPDSIKVHSEENPARIVIDIAGPTGAEAPQQTYPGNDELVTWMRVSKTFGWLQVVLDLRGNEPPPYTVHQMADYIMVRLAPPPNGRQQTETRHG